MIELEPNHFTAHRYLGFAYDMQGDVGRAIEHLEAALETDDSVPQVHYSLGWLYHQCGRPADAIEQMQATLQLDPDHKAAAEALQRFGGDEAPTDKDEHPASRAARLPVPPHERPSSGPDVELAIATAWLTRVGMVAILLAAAFLIKHAFAQGWITPQMLIGLGIIAGAVLMVVGELGHQAGFRVQSQALTGGGAAMLYLSLWGGQHLYDVLEPGLTFPAMVLVTIAAAAQAIRHRSQTVASFAWLAGYAVPFLIGDGSGTGSGGPGPVFAYLVLLSAAVFGVTYLYSWPAFTGLALFAAYVSGAYIFRLSDGSLGWTLTYLMILNAGMLLVAAVRGGRAGEDFAAVGGVVGYLVLAVTMFTAGQASPAIPYVYLLAMSGAALLLGHFRDWRILRWCGTLGGFLGFLLILLLFHRSGSGHPGNWMILYAAACAGGSLAVAAGRHRDAEPLAVSAVVAAYGSAALLAPASRTGAVSDGAMFAYLGLLAAAVLLLSGRFDWPTFSRLGFTAAFLATGLLYERLPGLGVTYYPLLYLAMLAPAALSVAAQTENRALGAIGAAGVFVAMPFTGIIQWTSAWIAVPVYLALAAGGTLIVIERAKWYGLEWITWAGTWLIYLGWRFVSDRLAVDPQALMPTTVFLLLFIAAAMVRHGLRGEPAADRDGALAAANAAAYFLFGFCDLGGDLAIYRGWFTLALFGVYLSAGLAGLRRRPSDIYFAPVHLAICLVLLTAAIPMLVQGYPVSILWALEAMVVIGLGFYYRASALRLAGLAVLVLPLLRALLVDSQISEATYRVLLNSRALSALSVIAVMYAAAYLYARHLESLTDEERWLPSFLSTSAGVLLFWITSAEAWTCVGWQLGSDLGAQHLALSAVWIGFAGVMMAGAASGARPELRWIALGLLTATALKILAIDPRLTPANYLLLVNNHAAPLLAIIAMLYLASTYFREDGRERPEVEAGMREALSVSASLLLWWLLSSEAWHHVGWSLQAIGDPQQYALSAVWTAYGAALVTVGLLVGSADLRWTAIVVFAVTVAKVFFLDLHGLDIVYRILALLGLGAVLIAVGFAYQHLVGEQADRAGAGRRHQGTL